MVTEKPNSIRTFDGDGFRKRAACICFRDETETEVLLVTSISHKDRWVVPGGGVEPLEEFRKTAVREVLEEAGVEGKLGRLIGIFEDKEKKYRTSVFKFVVTELLEKWDDSTSFGRRRKWFSVAEAHECLSYKPTQRRYLTVLFPDAFASG